VWWIASNNTSGNTTTVTTTPTPTSTASTVVLSEQPNSATFNQYFSEAYLAKLAIGQQVGPSNTTKTTTFNPITDQFCVNFMIKKTISSEIMSTAIYSAATKTDIEPKAAVGRELATGGSSGCQDTVQTAGHYEYKVYLNNVLAAVLPFDIQ